MPLLQTEDKGPGWLRQPGSNITQNVKVEVFFYTKPQNTSAKEAAAHLPVSTLPAFSDSLR